MIVLAYLESKNTTFHTAGWTCWFFMSLYLESSPDAILWWIRQLIFINLCANLEEKRSPAETLAIIRQAFGKESMTCTVQGRPKRTRQGKSKVKSMLNISFNMNGIVHKEFIVAGSAVYCECFTTTAWKFAKISPQTLATKELAVVSRQHTVSHFYTREIFLTKNNISVLPHLPYFPDLAPSDFCKFPAILTHLRSRQNRRPCWTPSRNTTSRIHLKRQKRWERCIHTDGDYFQGDGGQPVHTMCVNKLLKYFMRPNFYAFYLYRGRSFLANAVHIMTFRIYEVLCV
jgi:hypothetical protein